MKTIQFHKSRKRLEEFLNGLLALLGRSERRHWGKVYIRGLLLEGERKSIEPMAARMPEGNVQALQQFIGQSPWDWVPIRQLLAKRMVTEISPPAAWIVDDTGFPKQGKHSVGVARQYSGTLGKVGNCQVAVSLNYATDDACFPLDFSLYLPKEWIEDSGRRQKAGIPEDVEFQQKWQLALSMIDRAVQWGIPHGVIAADAGYGNISKFREELDNRSLYYVVGVDATTGVWERPISGEIPTYQGTGRPRKRPPNLPKTKSVVEMVQDLPADAWQTITWRERTKGKLQSRFTALRVQPSYKYENGKIDQKVVWLLAEWPKGEACPVKFWFSNLGEDITLKQLVRLAKIRWWVEQNYREMKKELGMDHYEGRTWRGWHHHITMIMIAFGFLVVEMLRGKKNFWVDPPEGEEGDAGTSQHMDWNM
jgi:SRSO17 transposase